MPGLPARGEDDRDYSRLMVKDRGGEGLRRREVCRTLQPKLFESAAQGARIEAKLSSGAVPSIDSPLCTIEQLKDMLALQLLKVIRGLCLSKRTRRP